MRSKVATVTRRYIVFLGLALLAAACAGPSARQSERERIMCGNQLNALYIAALGFGIDLADQPREQMPRDFQSMSNDGVFPALLICPSDRAKRPARNLSALTTDNVSYELVTPSLSLANTNGVFIRCPIHGFVIRPSGVFDGNRPLSKR